MNQKPIVISIAAVSGGGKTTITSLLRDRLKDSKVLFFDDYELEEYPVDICEWVDKGADYNEWNLAPLVYDVQNLISKNEQKLKYLLLDYPFAYLNNGLGAFIDFTVFIDTPLDIAMARRLLRDYNEASFNDLHNDMIFYLSRGRAAYQEMIKSVKPNSDCIIDGSNPPEMIVDQIFKEINKKVL
ncbi:hypothetical protein [Paenibacillus antarcticus]|uniref:Phosphoribulokinase/uridine kinase domain-containing protein n=1 Tax=Paenibacillus antarcticus TaxID=253703 RepID=A0A168PXR3_9BACL|nr:hypothetical protein [Paenibacillus antarcticus]OAB47170.1 hypothetical protein PBAT_07785 [Paenibacillus antarcticus]